MVRLDRTEAGSFSVARLLGWLFAGLPILSIIALACGVLGGALGAYLHFSADLPKIPDLRKYKPKTVSTFYAEDGTVIGIFYNEKRFPVPLSSLPRHVVCAFLAAEDSRFFSHTGVDFFGIARALITNLRAGTFAQGGSTITQQVTRNFLLSKEKRLSRKFQEAILSFRLEKTLSKEEILEIYLNEIYLGRGCYGVESAARTYFGKGSRDLAVAEAALLAGYVSNPSRFGNPRNLDAGLKRREFVLDSMLRCGFISQEEHQAATRETPKFRESLPTPYERVPYFTEAARQYIIRKYGENRLYNEGLKVWTTCDIDLQDKASEALVKGTKAWEKRQHRPAGLVRKLKPSEVKDFLKAQPRESYRVGDVVRGLVVEVHQESKQKGKQKPKQVRTSLRDCTLALAGNVRFRLEIESQVPYRPNQLLEFRVTDTKDGFPVLQHQLMPPVQGAVVSIENKTGYVKALVGGVDFERSRFNRAVQGNRQPGSAFKPFVFAAALEWANYSPNTLVVDEPIAVVTDPRKGEWIPGNSDGNYSGLISLRDALAHSRNVAAIKILMDVGVEPAARMARSMGIGSHLERNLSLCLGTSEVNPLEITSAYTVFPNMGIRVHPVLVKKVMDRFGNVLEDNTAPQLDLAVQVAQERGQGAVKTDEDYREALDPKHQESEERKASGATDPQQDLQPQKRFPSLDALLSGSSAKPPLDKRPGPERVLSPSTAYLMLSMLQKACVSGTAAAVTKLKRKDLGGKTGTTDENTDAWFIGFSPRLTTGVWVGYDTKVSLGKKEHGSTAALPVWMDFMKDALAGEQSKGYPVPEGIVFVQGVRPDNVRSQTDLLGAEPDLMMAAETKPVVPMDARLVQASAPADPMTGMPGSMININYGQTAGTVRIVSPTGEDLGMGQYVADDKGVIALRRDWNGLNPGLENVDYAGAAVQLPGALRSTAPWAVGQTLSDYARQMGWHQ